MSAPRPTRIDESLAELLEDLKRTHKERTGISLSTPKASKLLAFQLRKKKNLLDSENDDEWRLF